MKRLLDDVVEGRIGRLVITHKDRLLRFGAELVFAICEAKQVEVVILNQGEDTTFEEDLANDVLEIITVFSARLYGSRSRKNRKLLDDVKTGRGVVMLIANKIELRPDAGSDRLSPSGVRRAAALLQPVTRAFQSAQCRRGRRQRPISITSRSCVFEFPWYSEVSSRVARNAIDDLDAAFKGFFRRVKNGAKKPGLSALQEKGCPRFLRPARAQQVRRGRSGTLRIEKLKTRMANCANRLRFTGSDQASHDQQDAPVGSSSPILGRHRGLQPARTG